MRLVVLAFNMYELSQHSSSMKAHPYFKYIYFLKYECTVILCDITLQPGTSSYRHIPLHVHLLKNLHVHVFEEHMGTWKTYTVVSTLLGKTDGELISVTSLTLRNNVN